MKKSKNKALVVLVIALVVVLLASFAAQAFNTIRLLRIRQPHLF